MLHSLVIVPEKATEMPVRQAEQEQMRAELSGPYIILSSSRFDPNMMALARQANGGSRWINGTLRIDNIPENILLLDQKRNEFAIELSPLLVDQIDKLKRENDTLSRAMSEQFADVKFPFKTVPFEHQLRGWLWSRDLEACAYFLRPGQGKTKLALDVAHWNFEQGRIDILFIIAPNGVHSEWINEQAPKHLGCPWRGRVLFTQSNVSKLKRDAKEAIQDRCLFVVALNAEALSVKRGADLANTVCSLGRTMLVVDESSMFKNPSAKRTKALMGLRDKTVVRRILDGTPVSKGVEDLYAPLTFLRQGITGCATYTAFKNRFCVLGGYTGWDVVGYRDLETLYSRIKPFVYQPDIETNLPEKIVVERCFSLCEEERKAYDQLRKNLMLQLENTSFSVAEGAAKVIKLSQITSGFMLGDNLQVVWRVSSPSRLGLFRAITQEIRHYQFVVFAWFREEMAMIARALEEDGFAFDLYDANKSDTILNRFRSGKVQALVCQYQSGSIGLNLQHSFYGIFYSPTFSARLRWQAEARLHRQGQKHNVTFFELVARNTVDARWQRLRQQKENLAEMTRAELLDLVTDNP